MRRSGEISKIRRMAGIDPDRQAGDAVVVRLRVDPGEPLTGTAVVEGRPGETRFAGWVELMAAITAARAEPSDRGDPR
jgi:hypothetical protein